MIKCFGVRYTFHPLFTLLLLIAVVSGHLREFLTLFAIILIHEIGHVAAAKTLNWNVREVQLLPFGGVAIVEDNGRSTAGEEMIVALAGPLQNVLMIGFAYLFEKIGLWNSAWSSYFIQSNLFIAAFNLLPVLPLDGGKIVAALISYGVSYYRTLVVANVVSMGFSLVMIALSLADITRAGLRLNLLGIGVFLFYSNWQAYRNVHFQFMRFIMHRERRLLEMIRRGVKVRLLFVGLDENIWKTLRLLVRERVHLIYVFNRNGSLCAVFPEPLVLRAALRGDKSHREISGRFM